MSEPENEEQRAAPSSEDEPPEAPAPRGGSRLVSAMAVLAILAALAAIALSLHAYLVLQRSVEDAAARRAAVAALENRLSAVARHIDRLEGADAVTDSKLDELAAGQARMTEAMASLYERERGDNLHWALAEVEYLLVIATQRIALVRDPETALAALEAADRRLGNLDYPGLAEVRARLAADMNDLRSVESVDITGLSLFLSDLAQRAGTLPLREEYADPKPATGAGETGERPSGWRAVLSAVLRELKSLVVITRTEGGGAATLLPEERWFLVQNLRLQLETARLAVLRRDSATLHASADVAAGWLQEYFDTSAAGVSASLESLRRMGGIDLAPPLPDISSSLETVRAFIRERSERGGAGP